MRRATPCASGTRHAQTHTHSHTQPHTATAIHSHSHTQPHTRRQSQRKGRACVTDGFSAAGAEPVVGPTLATLLVQHPIPAWSHLPRRGDRHNRGKNNYSNTARSHGDSSGQRLERNVKIRGVETVAGGAGFRVKYM